MPSLKLITSILIYLGISIYSTITVEARCTKIYQREDFCSIKDVGNLTIPHEVTLLVLDYGNHPTQNISLLQKKSPLKTQTKNNLATGSSGLVSRVSVKSDMHKKDELLKNHTAAFDHQTLGRHLIMEPPETNKAILNQHNKAHSQPIRKAKTAADHKRFKRLTVNLAHKVHLRRHLHVNKNNKSSCHRRHHTSVGYNSHGHHGIHGDRKSNGV